MLYVDTFIPFSFLLSTFLRQSRANIARTLGPVLALAVMTVLVAGCTPSNTTTDGQSSSSEAMMQSSSEPAVMESSSISSETSMIPASSKAMVQEHAYTNGTFSAQGVYRSPAGGELVNVSLTLKNDVVTDASFGGTATNPKSKMMQAAFASGFKAQVVGKSLDEVSVGVVNGSSLTGNGFMDAVGKIKAQAKA